MNPTEAVTLSVEGRVAIITIQNPPVNVLTDAVRDGLYACARKANEDPAIAAVIFTGSGEKAFMAGANIKGFPDMIGKPGAAYGYARTIYEVWDYIRTMNKPTIAAIRGYCLGAGMELSLVCDLRVADTDSRFGFPEIALGLFPGGGGTQRMTKIAGPALTKEMIFTGKPISSERAYEAGYLNYVTPKGEALKKAKEIAGQIASFSVPILALAKTAITEGIGTTDREGISLEAEYWQDAFMTEDIREGVSAFLEKRKPDFHDC